MNVIVVRFQRRDHRRTASARYNRDTSAPGALYQRSVSGFSCHSTCTLLFKAILKDRVFMESGLLSQGADTKRKADQVFDDVLQ